MEMVTTTQSSAWFATLMLSKREVHFKLDTEAEVTTISEEAHQIIRKAQPTAPEKTLYRSS